MQDVRELAEDMREELKVQEPMLEQADSNLEQGRKATWEASEQLN